MNRLAIVIAMVTALGGPALADTREDVLSGIARCGALADDHAWLNCIYGAAQPMRGQLGLPPAPAAQIGLVPPPSAAAPRGMSAAPQPKESDGFFASLLGGAPVLSDVKLTDYRFDSHGFFTISLANGQVWEQQDGPLAHWKGAPSQYAASISKGAVGSFNLIVAGEDIRSDATYKVRRIR